MASTSFDIRLLFGEVAEIDADSVIHRGHLFSQSFSSEKAVTFSFVVTAATVIPTGKVTLIAGSKQIGTITLVKGRGSVTTSTCLKTGAGFDPGNPGVRGRHPQTVIGSML